MRAFPNELLDDLLADHTTRADVDRTIETVRALGLEPRPDVLRQQAAINEVEPDRAELVVALVLRRLSCAVTVP
ncbi:MAG: hypothetical protein B7Z14_14940 [Bosea sp. 32-68-6]|nr:MAG: hypothetical protein B7Z14_14940 [Bosea sp. 32-68-6]